MVVSADHHVHQRKVRAGIREGDTIQIVEGLQAGERVVGFGAYGLPENSKVKAESPSGGKPE